jgi:methylated-DNA-protein-cysteine methyltransferase-like protein
LSSKECNVNPRRPSKRAPVKSRKITPQISDDKNSDQQMPARVVRCIRALPAGKVSSYGAIAKAAGWPGAARQVVRILRQVPGLPWHRVLGAGGAIKLSGENAAEQEFRLKMEGVNFRGARVNMKLHEFRFPKTKRAR